MSPNDQPSLYDISLKLERLETLVVERMNNVDRLVADHKKDVNEMENRIERMEARNETTYITKTEFDPIKKLVYGAVTFILLAVLSSFMVLVIKTNTPQAPAPISSPVTTSSPTK